MITAYIPVKGNSLQMSACWESQFFAPVAKTQTRSWKPLQVPATVIKKKWLCSSCHCLLLKISTESFNPQCEKKILLVFSRKLIFMVFFGGTHIALVSQWVEVECNFICFCSDTVNASLPCLRLMKTRFYSFPGHLCRHGWHHPVSNTSCEIQSVGDMTPWQSTCSSSSTHSCTACHSSGFTGCCCCLCW